ncbi:MAG: hypothetical protein M1832_001180 [Thelocarpon impressellum]|nr:MAG: hypothetical protein M1832_001180 [Thelocarpon impressellum]
MDDPIRALVARNAAWADRTATSRPTLFPGLATGQSPSILWIGCADSRVPETTILDLQPGDVFVHRNIANVLHPGDLSSTAVVEYGVGHLGVQHVVLCGHTGCGGAAAALGNARLGVLDPWLLPLRALRAQHAPELAGLADDKQRTTRLVELNVQAGVRTLRQNARVIEASRSRGLKVHGLVYDIATGKLTELAVPEDEEEAKARHAAFNTA